jgi:hypothetical protein
LKSIDVYALGKKYFESYSISKIFSVATLKTISSVVEGFVLGKNKEDFVHSALIILFPNIDFIQIKAI